MLIAGVLLLLLGVGRGAPTPAGHLLPPSDSNRRQQRRDDGLLATTEMEQLRADMNQMWVLLGSEGRRVDRLVAQVQWQAETIVELRGASQGTVFPTEKKQELATEQQQQQHQPTQQHQPMQQQQPMQPMQQQQPMEQQQQSPPPPPPPPLRTGEETELAAGRPRPCACEASIITADIQTMKADQQALKLRTDRTEARVAGLFAGLLAKERDTALFEQAIAGERRRTQDESCRGQSLVDRVGEINAACCGGGGGADGGHRLLQDGDGSSSCGRLPKQCSSTCAPVFIAFREECEETMEEVGFDMQQMERLHESCLEQVSVDEGSCGAQIGRRILQRVESSQDTVTQSGATTAMIIPLTILTNTRTGMLEVLGQTGRRRGLQQGGGAAEAVQEFRCECGSAADISSCIPACDESIHGFELLLTIDQSDLRVSCKLHLGIYSWAGAVSEGSYFGTDHSLFLSVLVSGAEGRYNLRLLGSTNVRADTKVRRNQIVSIVGDELLAVAPLWGSGKFFAEQGGSLSMAHLQLDVGATILVTHGGELALARLVMSFGTLVSALAGMSDAGSRLSFEAVTISPSSYLGCFVDNGNLVRDLDGLHSFVSTAGQGISVVNECSNTCRDFKYMGLQWANECYCGNSYGSQGAVATTDCDSDGIVEAGGVADLCGDGTFSCGSHNAVYTVSHPTSFGGAMTGALTVGAVGEAWGITPPTLLGNLGLNLTFVVVSGPCTLAEGGKCVGRWPGGYLPNEQCEITTAGAGGGVLGPCPAFDTQGGDYLTLPDGTQKYGSICPVGTFIAPGVNLTWHSDSSAQGHTYGASNQERLAGLTFSMGGAGGGWQICLAA